VSKLLILISRILKLDLCLSLSDILISVGLSLIGFHIIVWDLSFEGISRREIACCLIVSTCEYLIERLLYFLIFYIWYGIDLSEEELPLTRDSEHHHVIFIGDSGIRPHISGDLDTMKEKYFSTPEPLYFYTREIFVDQVFEIAKGKWNDKDRV
jgi:hypothetical protein